MVRVLRDEQADIVLLQALQDGAGAQQERLALLRERLGALYPAPARPSSGRPPCNCSRRVSPASP
ncbi:hypothetical protein I0D68_12835 [Pseudomonas lalucatii]|nr:hypothetical protein I0D68_12835 [Pseudomonas lalucatii]